MKTLSVLIVILVSLTAHAQLTLVKSWTGGNPVSGGPGVLAIDFTEGALPQPVFGMGVFDVSGTGLTESHQVGLWDFATQQLLASTTVVPATATDIANFWYAPIAPLTLQAGHHYMLGAFYADNSLDLAIANATATVLAGATLGDAWLSTVSTFTFPDLNVSGADQGFFGANISFAPVPEPALWSLFTALALIATTLVVRASPPSLHSKAGRHRLESPDARPAANRVLTANRGDGALRFAKHAGLPPELRPREKLVEPPANRPPTTPGNVNGKRPTVPPGLANYASP